MKVHRLLPGVVLVAACMAAWIAFHRVPLQDPPLKTPMNAERVPRARGDLPESPLRRPAAKAILPDGMITLRNLAAREDKGRLSDESREEVDKLLTDAIKWSRKDLAAAAEGMLAMDLSTPRRSTLFGGLLNLLSAKDGAGALALHDRAWETSGFNHDKTFFVNEMVFNLADHDPARAIEWLESRKDRLPQTMTRMMLETIRENNP